MRSVLLFVALFGAAFPLDREAPALDDLAQDSLRSQKHFLWKVEAANGNAAYLVGSIHVLTADAYPLPAAIDQVFAESKTLVEEVNLDEMSDPAMMMSALSKAMLTDGKTLDQLVDARTYAEVQKRAEAFGMPMAALQRMKPWLVAVTLMAPTLQSAGFKPELGIDRHYFDRAKKTNMKREGLETLAYQLDRFDQMSPKLQEELLKATIEDLDTQVAGVNRSCISGCCSSAIRTGCRTSRSASPTTRVASSWSARHIWSAGTACRRCWRRRAIRSRNNRAKVRTVRTGAYSARLRTHPLDPRSTRGAGSGRSRGFWWPPC
jgi:hypothetical protein